MKAKARIVLLSFVAVLPVLACAPTVSQHGHAFDDELLSDITPGSTSRDEVRRLLGSPSTTATLNDDLWYYISQRRERMSFYQSEITDQEVVTISFDDRGIVEDVRRHDMAQAMAVEPHPDETRTLGNEFTILEQLIGNIGRFGTGEDGAPQAPTQP